MENIKKGGIEIIEHMFSKWLTICAQSCIELNQKYY